MSVEYVAMLLSRGGAYVRTLLAPMYARLRIQRSADMPEADTYAPAEAPSERLTDIVLAIWDIIGYNSAVRSAKPLRTCRVRYARKSSFAFIRSSCLRFVRPNAVKKSRSCEAESGSQAR
jgi:hypothetical protein